MLIAHEAPAAMFARELTALMIEGVAVAVVRRPTEHRDTAVVFDVAELAIVGDVAPDEIAPLRAPGGALVPHAAGEEALDCGVVDPELRKCRIDSDDVRIGIAHRTAGIVIAPRIRDHA